MRSPGCARSSTATARSATPGRAPSRNIDQPCVAARAIICWWCCPVTCRARRIAPARHQHQPKPVGRRQVGSSQHPAEGAVALCFHHSPGSPLQTYGGAGPAINCAIWSIASASTILSIVTPRIVTLAGRADSATMFVFLQFGLDICDSFPL